MFWNTFPLDFDVSISPSLHNEEILATEQGVKKAAGIRRNRAI